jgi:predicted short-subunit dehydrogenase-like oxidoreductase (DUF2520 family)
MKISIIGAGRVGQTLGKLARLSGYEIGDVVCRSQRSANRAVKFIGAGRAQGAARAELSPAGIILIATPDQAISSAIGLILKNADRVGRAVALHTSGALSSAALSKLSGRGLAIGSCHPLQTFQSPERALALVAGSYFCVEGEPRAARAARRLARDIGGRSFEIPTEMKSLYHAAAVMASGGVTALVSISLDLLARCGLSKSESSKVLLPLVEGTVASLRAVGPARALTGPVSRGDAETVGRNLEAVAKVDRRWLELYRLLAERSATLAEQSGNENKSLSEVRRLLR